MTSGPHHRHVERKNVCIYSHLKSCSSSEVAAMIEELLRHGTDAEIESQYVDTHGASVVGLVFTECSTSFCCRG
ncbi:Tn3 family transposase [Streptomyces sp. NRRL S-920]|uniref:Tn3 family transposase n=1 Tax=Streptomyces sp. NRRL S-920 TaxID=1463921 RepID=UPI00131C93CE|nr:Tn3 family transposase [Streptomyces sp. NRRL S-920]